MIELNSRGRLGNQLFQYACVKNFSIKWGENISVQFNIDENQLNNFNITDLKTIKKSNINLLQRIILIIFIFIRRIYSNNNPVRQQRIELKFQKKLNKYGIYWYTNGYCDFSYSKAKNKIFIGYFESEKYFSDIKDEIRKIFSPKNTMLNIDEQMIYQMKEKNSVCISIRRGDFISVDNIVCSKNYYDNAIKEMCNKIENPTFFAFSDDIEWVKKNIVFPGDVIYESGNYKPYETLYLMSQCKNFIISNSTFHWWAQFLSDNNKKIVIAPKRWRNFDIKLDIIQDDWILIDN